MKKLLLIALVPLLAFAQLTRNVALTHVRPPTASTVLDGSTQAWEKVSPAGVSFERNNSWSIAATIRARTIPGVRIIIGVRQKAGNQRGWAFYTTTGGTGTIGFLVRNSTASQLTVVASNNAISLQKTYRIYVTYGGTSDTNTVRFYVDGTASPFGVVTRTLSSTSVWADDTLSVGSQSGLTNVFNGSISECVVDTGVVWTQAQVNYFDATYKATNHFPTSVAGKRVFWTNWEALGYDKSGNGNTLSPVGSPPIIWSGK